MMQEYDDDFFFEEDKIAPAPEQAQDSAESPVPRDVTEEVSPECVYHDLRTDRYLITHQDLMGMTVTSGSVVLNKDDKNLIGISIGGGAPLCPCLYIVQIFDNTPASKEGTLQSGDELVGVNGQSVKGKTKVEVAKMIQAAKDTVTINYNKLHADPRQGKSLDIILKKMKHRLVESMSAGAADALGLSRAILCNDSLLAKLDELRDAELVFKRMVDHCKRMLKSYLELVVAARALGEVFACIGVREPQPRASAAFTRVGAAHRRLHAHGLVMLKALKPILADMGTYLNKAIPDTKLTIRKYADTKFEYLSYCLKVKEMDDEECSYNALQEPLYRVETGNYEYRLVLRCRGGARARFAALRADVLVKLALLRDKRARDTAHHLATLVRALARYHNETLAELTEIASLFPVEVDLSQNAFQYKSTQILQDSVDDDDDLEYGKEIKEYHDLTDCDKEGKEASRPALGGERDGAGGEGDSLRLLTELGLDDFGDFQNGLMDDFVSKSDDVDDVFEKLLSDLNTEN